MWMNRIDAKLFLRIYFFFRTKLKCPEADCDFRSSDVVEISDHRNVSRYTIVFFSKKTEIIVNFGSSIRFASAIARMIYDIYRTCTATTTTMR